MKIIRISHGGTYTHHGIAYTEHDGYQGTADNRLSVRAAISAEMRYIQDGEQYQVEIDDVNKGTFVKGVKDYEHKR